MKNPIIGGRIVSDVSFALRLKHFLEQTDVCDQSGEEEKDYLLWVANNLLKYQTATVTDKDEINYLKLNGLIHNYTNKYYTNK